MSPLVTDAALAYAMLNAEATRLAGMPDDIAQRSALLYRIALDSHGNHPFPLIVLHGTLWADGFLAHTRTLATLLAYRYRYAPHRATFYAGVLQQFAENLKTINRQVFIDTYTSYYFTAQYGRDPAACGDLPPDLFAALHAMHEATRADVRLSTAERRHLYLLCLHREQEKTVAPGVERAVAAFTSPLLRRFCLRPPVHFAYFPRGRVFFFRDFSRKEERVARAIRAYDLAEECGWAAAVAAVARYGVLPDTCLRDPAGFADALTHRILAPAQV